ncbi:GTP-binding protein [Kosmotoga arenicorallina]|nr:GTP-binding protein [Kosmotoga arenicorallina]
MPRILLITGFLGAGKTTLIKNIITAFEGKIGLIVNEFGKAGFDGKWLYSKGIELIELVNGSIFCSCLEPKFIDAIKTMLAKKPDLIIVESSGLSDPNNMGFVLSKATESKELLPEFLGAITVIDASRVELIENFPVLQKQIEVAKLILLNKSDLTNHETLEKMSGIVHKLNPKTRILKTRFCVVPDLGKKIFNTPEKPCATPGVSTNTPQSREKSVLLKTSGASPEGILSFLKEFSPEVLRIKGEIETSRGWYRIDCTGSQVNFEKLENHSPDSCMVIISSREKPIIKELKRIWSRYNDRKISLK